MGPATNAITERAAHEDSRVLRGIAATALIAVVLLVGACGAVSDKQQITGLIKAFGSEPSKLCTTFATPTMIQAQFGNRAFCLRAASSAGAKDPAVKVDSVSVSGKTATAIRTSGSDPGKGTKAIVRLVKVGSSWKVQSVAPH